MIRIETIKLMIVVATSRSWKLHQFNVNSGFLNGASNEEVYVKKLLDFEANGSRQMIYIFRKTLYGLF